MSAALAECRPRDESAAAIRDALAALSREKAAIEDRRQVAAANRATALSDPTASVRDIIKFEAQEREATIELERVALLQPDLVAKLQVAAARERDAKLQLAVVEARKDVAAAVEALRAALPDYAEAAAVIVRVCRLAESQTVALQEFSRAALAARQGASVPMGYDDPGIAAISNQFGEVSLPGLPGKPWLRGAPPLPNRVPHIYQNSPQRWGP